MAREEAPQSPQAQEGGSQEGHAQEGRQAAPEGHQKPADGQEGTAGEEDGNGPENGTETFPRQVVEKLRAENAELRIKAKRSEELSARLLAATIQQATAGILADPTDLPVSSDLYDEDGWPDPEAIADAARELLERKPHLADRRPSGPLEQGPREQKLEANLANILRTLAS